jgi:DNA-directed RNA polymerase sigma subunit (sigma70/sigma32)
VCSATWSTTRLRLDVYERVRAIVAAPFGFDGRRPRRLDEIGAQLGLSGEHVRQLEERALAKLRRNA